MQVPLLGYEEIQSVEKFQTGASIIEQRNFYLFGEIPLIDYKKGKTIP
jgi:hypothetical protein